MQRDDNVKKRDRVGMFIVIACGMMWGLGGVMGQILFRYSDMSPALLSSVRMTVAGTLLTMFCVLRRGKESLRILHSGWDTAYFIFYAMTGIMTMQFSYFAAVDASNAATATVIQYIYPILILICTSIHKRKKPRFYEIVAVLSAFLGVFVVATHCNLMQLNMSRAAVFWGLVAAISYVVYTIAPGGLFKKYGLVETIGIGMLFGGMVLFALTGSYRINVTVTPLVVLITIFITLFSSLIPMVLYGKGVAMLGSMKASLFVTVEPVFCTLVSVGFGLTNLVRMDFLGFLLILIPIEFIAYVGGKDDEKKG